MIIEFAGGQVFDTGNDADMEKMARAKLAAEKALALMQEQVTALHESFQAAMMRPAVAHTDNSDVVAELQKLQSTLETGVRRIVTAQLADTVIRRDPVSGDPERSVKVIKD